MSRCRRRRYFRAKLDDLDNACAAYEKAIGMESDHLFHLNYAVTLLNCRARAAGRSLQWGGMVLFSWEGSTTVAHTVVWRNSVV